MRRNTCIFTTLLVTLVLLLLLICITITCITSIYTASTTLTQVEKLYNTLIYLFIFTLAQSMNF